MAPLCLVLSDDLLDASRVIGDGRAAGLAVLQCRDIGGVTAALERLPVLVVLDLHHPGLDGEALVPILKAVGAKVIGYGSHVDAARLKAGRKAGCDEVLPRSAFFDGLEGKLRAWAGIGTPPVGGDSRGGH
jgi:DNA-binding response OmpR family regulator